MMSILIEPREIGGPIYFKRIQRATTAFMKIINDKYERQITFLQVGSLLPNQSYLPADNCSFLTKAII